MAEVHGKNGRIYLNGVSIKLTQNSFDMPTDDVEVSGFGDANKRYVTGKPDMSGTFSGFWDNAGDPAFAAAITSRQGTPSPMIIYPDFVNAPTKYAYGNALINASLVMDTNAAVVKNGSWKAADNWVVNL
jgi:hypothetical protein